MQVVVANDDQGATTDGTHTLVATDRNPNTADIGLNTAVVQLTENEHVEVGERLRTSADGIFAVGDRGSSPHFTHIGFENPHRSR